MIYSTECSILPKDWDSRAQRPIIRQNRKDLWAIKRKIDDITAYCEDIFIDSNYGLLELEEFKRQLDIKIGKTEPPALPKVDAKPVEKKPTLLEFMEQELKLMKSHHMPSSTCRGFKLHVRILKDFAKKRGKFTYEDIDWNFRWELIDWLTEQNFQLSYGNKTLKVLHNFLKRARRKKLHDNTNYRGKGWTVPQKKVRGHKVILNTKELQILADLKLFDTAEKVRDLFLIGAGVTGLDLWKELHEKGFRGSLTTFYIKFRALIGTNTLTKNKIQPVKIKVWSSRRMSFLLSRDPQILQPEELNYVETLLKINPKIQLASHLTRQFVNMVNSREKDQLDNWISEALENGIAPLKNFAIGLQSDYDAVKAALSLKWSNGQVEGQVNRLKTIKRQMYGRASFELLRKRVLMDSS